MQTKAMATFFATALIVFAVGAGSAIAEEHAKAKSSEDRPVESQLNELKLKSAKQTPPKMLEAGRQGNAELEASGFLDKAVKPGEKAPKFSLSDAHGKTVSSDDLLEKGPIVLVFYRGAWCPFCNLYLNSLQEYLPQFEAMGAQLVAVSGESPDNSLAVEESNKLTFTVLSDPGLKVAKEFGIAYELPTVVNDVILEVGFDMAKYYGTEKAELPVSATYVIQEDGTIAYAFAEVDYKVRAEPADVLEVLETLQ
jgi:peroxiredoxin